MVPGQCRGVLCACLHSCILYGDVRRPLQCQAQAQGTADWWTVAPGQSLTLASLHVFVYITSLFCFVTLLFRSLRLSGYVSIKIYICVGTFAFCLTTLRTDYICTFLTKIYIMQMSPQVLCYTHRFLEELFCSLVII